MKWWGSFLVLFALFFIAIPSVFAADYNCPPNQEIFRISSQTNAHAELVSGGGNYATDICFDDYFGNFNGVPDRNCGVNNPPILKLSQTSNAHVEIPSLSNYGLNVCFSGLSCIVQPSTSACPAGKIEIASLSANTNAHVGIPGTYNGAGNYRLCCSAGAGVPSSGANFTSTEWRNSQGIKIGRSVNRTAYVNQTVTLFAQTGFAPNTNITFEVWEDDSGANPTPDDFIRNFTALTASDGSVQTSYFIRDSDTQIGESEPSPLEFYFKAHTTNRAISSEVNRSEIMDVSTMSPPNGRPNVTITAPVHMGVYFKDNSVLFNQSSFDPDGDFISYRWNIIEDNYVNTNSSFVYTFTGAGQKTVSLRVTDSRGAASEVQVAVLVIASPGALVYINKPSHRQTILNSTLWVKINASDSYAINSVNSGACPTVSCLAGRCPSQTQNSPIGCPQQTLNVQNTPQNFNRLYFDWSFNDGDSGSGFDGFGQVAILKRFGSASASSFDKQINLQINYTNVSIGVVNLLSSANRVFTLLGDQCIDSGRTFVGYDMASGQEVARYATMNSSWCAGADGVAGNAGDCCPVGYACSTSVTNPGCRPTNLARCDQYTNRTICNDDPLRLSNSSSNPGWNIGEACGSYVNGTVVSCRCAWNGTSENSGMCQFKKEFQGTTTGGSCTPASCTYGSTTPTDCVDGFSTVFVSATYASGTCSDQGITQQECESAQGQQAILCGQPDVALGLFDYRQFIMSIIVIAGVYFLLYRRKV